MNKLIDVIRHRISSATDEERSKLWRYTTSYRENLSPEYSLRRDKLLSCVKFTGKKRTPIRVLVGKERQVFQVEPQILDHGIVQCLLERSNINVYDQFSGESPVYQEDIFLDCDAILFEHILWLLDKDDPSLRNFNLDELMEFYT